MLSNIEYKEKLRKSGLRPTKQRIRICEVLFSANKTFHFTINDLVKMIEIKLSQGAKPGHGGILPAGKNYPEIAEIRGVKPYTEIISPPFHSAFSTPLELIDFI